MQLKSDGITARAYAVTHRFWRSLLGDEYIHTPAKSDLCTVMRTILVAGPFALLVNAAAIVWVLFAVGYLLFAMAIHATAVGFFVVLLLAVATLIAAFFGGGWLLSKLFTTRAVKEVVSVTGEYYRAKKANICPIIEIVGSDK